MTHVKVRVRNTADLERSWEGLFLVDTGAVDTLVPGNRLRELGLAPAGSREYELADGREIRMEICGAQLDLEGETVWGTVIFGPDGAEPILGVTALESAGLEVDPRTQRLKKLPAVRLK